MFTAPGLVKPVNRVVPSTPKLVLWIRVRVVEYSHRTFKLSLHNYLVIPCLGCPTTCRSTVGDTALPQSPSFTTYPMPFHGIDSVSLQDFLGFPCFLFPHSGNHVSACSRILLLSILCTCPSHCTVWSFSVWLQRFPSLFDVWSHFVVNLSRLFSVSNVTICDVLPPIASRYSHCHAPWFSLCRIIHEAGEAEASGPGPWQGPGPPGTTKNYKVGPLLAPKFLERKFAVF